MGLSRGWLDEVVVRVVIVIILLISAPCAFLLLLLLVPLKIVHGDLLSTWWVSAPLLARDVSSRSGEVIDNEVPGRLVPHVGTGPRPEYVEQSRRICFFREVLASRVEIKGVMVRGLSLGASLAEGGDR